MSKDHALYMEKLLDPYGHSRSILKNVLFPIGQNVLKLKITHFLIKKVCYFQSRKNLEKKIKNLLYTFPNVKFYTFTYKLNKLADNNFKFDEMAERSLNSCRNHCGKTRNRNNEQFLLFPECFQKTCTAGT